MGNENWQELTKNETKSKTIKEQSKNPISIVVWQCGTILWQDIEPLEPWENHDAQYLQRWKW